MLSNNSSSSPVCQLRLWLVLRYVNIREFTCSSLIVPFLGTQYTDQLTLAPGLVIPKQSIGVASYSAGLHGVDGVLGCAYPCYKYRFRLTQFNRIGPVGLTSDTLSTGQLIPTITDNLFSQGTITSNLFGISFNPTTTEEDTHGSIAFGGPDRTKFTGEINYTALTSTAAALEYWAIDQSVTCTFAF
jgi:cathepsin E